MNNSSTCKGNFPFLRSMTVRAVFGVAFLCLWGCSSQRHNFFSKAYHNTTARYNYYFVSKETMREIEKGLWTQNVDDYNGLLRIYPLADSATGAALRPKLDYIIKMASKPIQWHKNSKWVDDCYILIGKARMYGYELGHAKETFKYVNTKSEDAAARHYALIQLIHTYMKQNESEKAFGVIYHLSKETLNKKNRKEFYTTNAHYFVNRGDIRRAVDNMELAIPLIRKKREKARALYILAQLYQRQQNDTGAYKSFARVLKNNPVYEMGFNAKLGMIQSASITDAQNVKQVYKYFKKLLKDDKNEEFKDKIYYELARFEYRQKHYDLAETNYKESVKVSTKNTLQKSYSYLGLANMYYDNFKRYEESKMYYDSALTSLPTDHPDYDKILRRKNVLDEFVRELKIYRNEDSLQTLAKMDSAALAAFVNDAVEKEKERVKKEFKEQQKALRKAEAEANALAANFGDPNDPNAGGGNGFVDAIASNAAAGDKWYFSDPTLIARGKTQFMAKWGKRPLRDNWRIASMASLADVAENDDKPGSDSTAVKKAGKDKEATELSEKEQLQELLAGVTAEKFYEPIPLTEEKLTASNQKLAPAMYNLGRIYHLKLDEPENALEMFDKYLTRFPKDTTELEALYSMYVITGKIKKPAQDVYKNRILDEYPESFYAKIIRNPNYVRDTKMANAKVLDYYKEGYELYQNDRLDEAWAVVNSSLEKLPESDYNDRMMLLRILILGKKQNFDEYERELIDFTVKYQGSTLMPYAQKLYTTYRAFKTKK